MLVMFKRIFFAFAAIALMAGLYLGFLHLTIHKFKPWRQLFPSESVAVIKTRRNWMGDFQQEWLLSSESISPFKIRENLKRFESDERDCQKSSETAMAKRFSGDAYRNKFGESSKKWIGNFTPGEYFEVVTSEDNRLIYLRVFYTF